MCDHILLPQPPSDGEAAAEAAREEAEEQSWIDTYMSVDKEDGR